MEVKKKVLAFLLPIASPTAYMDSEARDQTEQNMHSDLGSTQFTTLWLTVSKTIINYHKSLLFVFVKVQLLAERVKSTAHDKTLEWSKQKHYVDDTFDTY